MNEDKPDDLLLFKNKPKVAPKQLVDSLKKNIENIEGLITLSVWKNGSITINWTDRNLIGILGLLELAKDIAKDKVRGS